ncbi:hypothetical protein EVAR_54717_1 [Eumeta japonica]|uniref:Uncharacterized protein n=1 Tax=Eumeta variegata TaxID=151549 RepID=A0A4C1YSN9_EUMVA|nr:hypothetical protein EVAR_54717_1 [Eumeta japonica]
MLSGHRGGKKNVNETRTGPPKALATRPSLCGCCTAPEITYRLLGRTVGEDIPDVAVEAVNKTAPLMGSCSRASRGLRDCKRDIFEHFRKILSQTRNITAMGTSS